jgi:hypothetical protein
VSTIDETPRPATFRCPAGAWFGTQIGGTVWMLTGAMSLAVTSPSAAAVNVVGVSLWLRRERVGQYTAVQFMLLACGIGSLAAMLTCDFAGPAVVGEAVPAKAYLILLVYPAVMVMVAVSNAALKQQLAARPG